MAVTSDYSRRTQDLCIYTDFNWSDANMQEVAVSLNGADGGLICSGIVKLAQKVLTGFLSTASTYGTTPESSLAYYLQTGESQPTILYAAIITTLADVTTFINNALADDAPDDERISSLKLTSWDYNRERGELTVDLEVISVGGTSYPLIIPLKVGTIS